MPLWSKRAPLIKEKQPIDKDITFEKNSFYEEPPKGDPYNIEMVENQSCRNDTKRKES